MHVKEGVGVCKLARIGAEPVEGDMHIVLPQLALSVLLGIP
jgi:hypothetical protein